MCLEILFQTKVFFFVFFQSNVKRSEVQNVPSNNVGRNRTNSVSSITSGSSTGSSSNSSITTGQSPSSNEGFHPPPRRAALLQDNRTRYNFPDTELQKKVSRPIHVAFICAFSRFLPCCQVEGLQRYQTSRIDRVYDSFPQRAFSILPQKFLK